MIQRATQDYLKAVYILAESGARATTSMLAAQLGVKPSSVTAMMKKLASQRPRLIDYKTHQGVQLTKAGRKIALDMIRRHRLLEQFLVATLGFTWDEVHDEAERLEHGVSDAFVERLDRFLDFPKRDPHGRPIPDKEGKVQQIVERRLSDMKLNAAATVSSVGSEEPEFLRYLSQMGLVPGVDLRVSEIAAVGNTIRIDVLVEQNSPAQYVVSASLSDKIFVTPKT